MTKQEHLLAQWRLVSASRFLVKGFGRSAACDRGMEGNRASGKGALRGAAMSTAPAIGSNRLPVLASSINDHLAAAETATRRGLEHAIAAGLLLIEAKELVDHGEWLTWLQANCRVGM